MANRPKSVITSYSIHYTKLYDRVSGRGELHLGILIENMRREGFELAVSRPEVIMKVENGVRMEPMETLTVDIEEQHQGSVMEKLGERKADLRNMSYNFV